MPSEPAESNFKNKVHARAYPTHERGGIVWAYMGPREVPPPLPDMEANIMTTEPTQISILMRKCNWMQGLEGELDTVHAAFLHFGADRLREPGAEEPQLVPLQGPRRRRTSSPRTRTSAPPTAAGVRPKKTATTGASATPSSPSTPCRPPDRMGPDVKMNAYVPMDDEHTLQWEVFYRTDGPARPQRVVPINRTSEPQDSGRGGNYMPQGTGWYDRWTLEQTLENDYEVDREAQKNWESYSGIPGVRQQDMAVTETMGPIYDRSHEHLGTSDSMIIRTRRRWLAVAQAFAEQGVLPPNVDNPGLPPALRRGRPSTAAATGGTAAPTCARSRWPTRRSCSSRRKRRPPAANVS